MIRSTYLKILFAVCALALGCSAHAETKDFNVPGGALKKALSAYVKQAGIQLVYKEDDVKGVKTQGVSGALSPEEALERLLAGTQLSAHRDSSGAIAIVAGSSQSGVSISSLQGGVNLAQADQAMQKVEKAESSIEGDSKKKESASADSTAASPQGGEASFSNGIPEILVTGKKGHFSLNADIERTADDIQPYLVLSRETIQSSGAANIQDLLKSRLTMNYAPEVGIFSQSAPVMGVGNTSSIALRGLDFTQTLILIDGRRVVSGSIGGSQLQPDLNGIPLSAVERIEVLPATASGIYGGGAVGGVINVVLRRDYRGMEVGLNFGSSFRNDGAKKRVDLNGGTTFFRGETSVLLNASFTDTDPILVRDRDFIQQYRLRVFEEAGGPTGVPIGASTNVLGLDSNFQPTNLELRNGTALNSPRTWAPIGYAGIDTDGGAALASNAGRFNTDLASTAQVYQANADIEGATTVRAISLALRQDLWAGFSAFAELSASRNDSYFNGFYASPSVILSPGDVGNPFQQQVLLTFPIYVDEAVGVTKVGNRRVLFGIKRNIGKSWSAEFDYNISRYDLLKSVTSPNDIKLTPSLQADAKAGTIDLFKDDSQQRLIAAYLLPGVIVPATHSLQNELSVRLAGSIIDLPAGAVSSSFLIGYRKSENAESSYLNALGDGTYAESRFSDQSEGNYSAYAEINAPIVSETNTINGIRRLDLQLAGRYDYYRQVAGFPLDSNAPVVAPINRWHSIDPTVGVRYQPFDKVTLRASFATGFQPPELTALVPPRIARSSGRGTRDPKRGNERVSSISLTAGGNPDLQPEESRSTSAGLIFQPNDSLRFSIDWTEISKKDNIRSIVFNQDAINNEDVLPGVITRGPVAGFSCTPICPITGFNSALTNIALARSESYDFSMNYTRQTQSMGVFAISTSATRMISNITQLTALASKVDSAGQFTYPTWAAASTLEWQQQRFGLDWSVRYYGSYWVNINHQPDPNFGITTIGSAAYHDIGARYSEPKESGPKWFSGVEFRIGINNLFDRLPRFSPLST